VDLAGPEWPSLRTGDIAEGANPFYGSNVLGVHWDPDKREFIVSGKLLLALIIIGIVLFIIAETTEAF
jgi:preprotein translocase subunit Sss1